MLGYYYYTTKIKPYVTEPQRASYTLLVFNLLVLLLFGLFLYFATQDALFARAELTAGRAYEQKIAEKIVALGQAKQNIAAALPALSQLEEDVPTGPSQPALVAEFYGDAATAGVSLTHISFPGEKDPKAASLRFNLNALGTYARARTFLRALEEGRLLTFTRVQITKRGLEDLWDINIVGDALYLK